jgi:hypothetical protein
MLRKHALQRMVRSLLPLVLIACSDLVWTYKAEADNTPIPELQTWESNMTTYGRQNCNILEATPSTDQPAYTYYDAERVYYQITAYTGDPTWRYCANLAEAAYRDRYVLPNNGGVPGYWNFTRGLLLDYQKTADATSKEALVLLSQRGAFCADGVPLDWTKDAHYSREVAYCISALLNAETVGEPRRTRLNDLATQAFGHIDQWFISKNASYMRPFMVGLTLQALIQYYEISHDSRVPSAVKTVHVYGCGYLAALTIHQRL